MDPQNPALHGTAENGDRGDHDRLGDLARLEDGQRFLSHIPPHRGIDLLINRAGLQTAADPVNSPAGNIPRQVAAVGIDDQNLGVGQRSVADEGDDRSEPFLSKLQAGVERARQVVGDNGYFRNRMSA